MNFCSVKTSHDIDLFYIMLVCLQVFFNRTLASILCRKLSYIDPIKCRTTNCRQFIFKQEATVPIFSMVQLSAMGLSTRLFSPLSNIGYSLSSKLCISTLFTITISRPQVVKCSQSSTVGRTFNFIYVLWYLLYSIFFRFYIIF